MKLTHIILILSLLYFLTIQAIAPIVQIIETKSQITLYK